MRETLPPLNVTPTPESKNPFLVLIRHHSRKPKMKMWSNNFADVKSKLYSNNSTFPKIENKSNNFKHTEMKKQTNNSDAAMFFTTNIILAIIGEATAVSILSERGAGLFWYIIFSIPSLYFIAEAFRKVVNATK